MNECKNKHFFKNVENNVIINNDIIHYSIEKNVNFVNSSTK